MKKLLLSAALLLLGVNGYAGSMYNSCNDCGSFIIGADWLYWKAFQDGMEYASFVSGSNGVINSRPVLPNFNLTSGFRVKAAYSYCNDFWQIAAIFTRFSPQDTESLGVAVPIANQFIVLNSSNFPVFSVLNPSPLIETQFSSLDSSWSSPINYLDVDISHLICVCPCIQVIPHMGFRGVWIREELTIDGVAPTAGVISSNFTENYNGYGLEGGFSALYHLGWGLSLRGHLGGALLYARIKSNESLNIVPSTSPMFMINAIETFYHLNPMIDGFIGLEYQRCVCNHFIDLHFGWEQHIILDMNHFGITSADFTFQGLVLGGSIAF